MIRWVGGLLYLWFEFVDWFINLVMMDFIVVVKLGKLFGYRCVMIVLFEVVMLFFVLFVVLLFLILMDIFSCWMMLEYSVELFFRYNEDEDYNSWLEYDVLNIRIVGSFVYGRFERVFMYVDLICVIIFFVIGVWRVCMIDWLLFVY